VIALLGRLRRRRAEGHRGQAMLEMALILPVLLFIVLGTMEFGFVMDHKLTLQYASREGARVGAALAHGGGTAGCGAGQSPFASTVDPEIIAAVARILQSSDSNIEVDRVGEIRIYEAGADGEELGPVNVWVYSPEGGPSVDGVALDFAESSHTWDTCSRINYGANPDSLGVSVSYTYFSRTPLSALMNLISISMYDYAVFELNPTNS
jgi:hypothetical protein